jgi:hypothetical protein
MLEGSLRILIQQLTGRDQMPSHRVGGRLVQSRELAPYFRRQLLGLDGGGDDRPDRGLRASILAGGVLGLGAAGSAGTRTIRSAGAPAIAARGTGSRGTTLRTPAGIASPVIDHP